jgi:hypothetical protein
MVRGSLGSAIYEREVWRWRVTDISEVPKKYLTVDERALNEIARTKKEKARVKGIEFYPEKITATRT